MSTVKEHTQQAIHDAKHSAEADQAKGRGKEFVGKVKEKVGGAIGDHQLQAEGHLEHTEGTKDRLKGEIKEKIESLKDGVAATIAVAKEKIAEHRAEHRK